MISYLIKVPNTIMNIGIIIVGVGGTGSIYAGSICRYLATLQKEKGKDYKVLLIDGDIVEAKNLSRQLYTDEDINEKKALCFAEAIEETLGIEVSVYDQYLDSIDTFQEILSSFSNSFEVYSTFLPIVIGCVDNHRARQILHQYFDKVRSCIYIDSANEYDYGEIVTGVKEGDKILSQPKGFYFPEVLTDNSPSKTEQSCGVINLSSPQHIVTNTMAATLLLSETINVLTSGKFEPGILYFYPFEGKVFRRRVDNHEKEKK